MCLCVVLVPLLDIRAHGEQMTGGVMQSGTTVMSGGWDGQASGRGPELSPISQARLVSICPHLCIMDDIGTMSDLGGAVAPAVALQAAGRGGQVPA